MTSVESALLRLLRAALHGETEELTLSAEDGERLLRLAGEQKLLPLVYDAAYRCASFRQLEAKTQKYFQERALRAVTRQVVQGNEFLTLLLRTQAQGLDPVVLKGVTVRRLYPMPLLRPSVDEDLLIHPDEAEAYHAFFLSEGLTPDEPEADLSQAHELSYHRPNSPTYIELHRFPFPPDSAAYGDLNALFEGALERSEQIPIEDVLVRALAPTDRLLYLICHAYKHFLHSGIGLRQVADIAVTADALTSQIDWARILDACEQVHIARFCAAIFRIGERHLGFAAPEAFSNLEVDEGALLEDILAGGDFGTADESRLHSSTITLDAVAAQRQGRARAGLRRSLFPGREYLQRRFPYAGDYPILLPLAWAERLLAYVFKQNRQAAEALKSGEGRVALLKQYGVIEELKRWK